MNIMLWNVSLDSSLHDVTQTSKAISAVNSPRQAAQCLHDYVYTLAHGAYHLALMYCSYLLSGSSHPSCKATHASCHISARAAHVRFVGSSVPETSAQFRKYCA